MKRVTTWVGNTAARLTDTLDEVKRDGTTAPMQFAGRVERVDLMGVDTATEEPIAARQATLLETSDPATWGQVEVTPDPADVAAARTVAAWWRITFLGGGVLDTGEFLWAVEPHGVPATGTASATGVGAWASNADVVAYANADDGVDYTTWIMEASELLYVLTARRFPGEQAATVRPCIGRCGHWQVLSRGHLVRLDRWGLDGWGWPVGVGCGYTPSVALAGYARGIDSVTIGGAVVDPATYRLDRHRDLVRLTDPATGQNPGWPLCQDVALPEDAPGTFTVRYRWGAPLPASGRRAAALLAYQLYLADTRSGKCKLPAGWTTLARQGVTVSRAQAQRVQDGGTGIVGIDTFIAAANPNGLDRPPAVYSPDVPGYPRRVG